MDEKVNFKTVCRSVESSACVVTYLIDFAFLSSLETEREKERGVGQNKTKEGKRVLLL